MNNSKLRAMAYCKHTGKPLPANLYNDSKGRRDVYRYRQEDGRYTLVHLPYARAVAAAKRANRQRNAPDGSTSYWVYQFKQHQLNQDPSLNDKRGWRDRHRQLERFADEWDHLRPIQLTVSTLDDWWSNLSYDQQHNRQAYFSRFFQWCMKRGVVRSNPFTKRDDVPRLEQRRKPEKQRSALSLDDYHQIYEEAPEWLRVAMAISLHTTMRAGDVVALRFDKITDGLLQTTIQKSLNQRGASAAAHLEWSLFEHVGLKAAIDAGRELSMRHRRCPYIVSRPRLRATKPVTGHTHTHQCNTGHVSREFADARDRAGVEGPTFHEIRGLAISLLLNQGFDIAAVQRLAAHTDATTTSAYTAGQAPHYLNMKGLVVPVTGTN